MSKKPSEKSFGLLFGFVFLLISIWPIFSEGNIRAWALVLSLIFFSISLIKPNLLRILNNLWIKLGISLGSVIAPIIMFLIFFFILTPISILLRILGKDLLNIKFSNSNSYWHNRDKNSESMDKQY